MICGQVRPNILGPRLDVRMHSFIVLIFLDVQCAFE